MEQGLNKVQGVVGQQPGCVDQLRPVWVWVGVRGFEWMGVRGVLMVGRRGECRGWVWVEGRGFVWMGVKVLMVGRGSEWMVFFCGRVESCCEGRKERGRAVRAEICGRGGRGW